MNYLNISNDKVKDVGNQLNLLLSSYHIYYQNLRSFHWHIKGSSFFDIHAIFEKLYNHAQSTIDELAERIQTIGEKPFGSLTEYLINSKVLESQDQLKDYKMVDVILENHKILIQDIRQTIDLSDQYRDYGTSDMLTSILFKLEKNSWKLTAWKGERKAGFQLNHSH